MKAHISYQILPRPNYVGYSVHSSVIFLIMIVVSFVYNKCEMNKIRLSFS